MLPIESAFEFYADLDGKPLDNGYIYFGQVNQNPVTAPVTVYWDAAGTQPAAQPLRVMNGYIVRSGTPANVFASDTYSQLVLNKQRQQVYYAPDSSAYSVINNLGASNGASFIGGGIQTVSNYAALRLLLKTSPSKFAYVLGANAAGDSGGGAYYYDASDVTSADNGGTIIVAADGGRWKMAPDGVVMAQHFGVKGDNFTDNYAPIQAYVTWALAAGHPIVFGEGSCLCSGRVTGSGKPVAMYGNGPDNTKIVFTGTNGGFGFTLDPQSAGVPPQQMIVRDMTLESRNTVGFAALSATWTTRQPNAQGQFWAENMCITRKADGSGSFTEGILLVNCVGGYISRTTIVGDDARVSNFGVRFASCIEILCDQLRISRYKEAVNINKALVGDPQSEGVFLNDCFFYDVNRGVYSPSQAIHINLIGTFINPNGASADAGITLTNASQCTIANCLIYVGGNPTDPGGQDGIRIIGTAGGNKVIGCQFAGVTKANARAAIVTSAATPYNTFECNNISSFSGSGIFISDAGDRGNRIIGNEFFNCTINITDSGVGTFKAGNTSTATAGANPLPISAVAWGVNTGGFAQGVIAADANWGGFLYPYNGAFGDLALADSGGTPVASTETGRFALKSYAKASLPSAAATGAGMYGVIIVTDDVGGLTLAFSDGTNWRRVQDRNVIS